MRGFFALAFAAMAAATQVLALDYTREEKVSMEKPSGRERVLKTPYIFPESQLKYGLFQNYLHYWIDRPLFFDRSMRYPSGTFAYTTKPSFLKNAEIVTKYEADGLGNLANCGSHQAMYKTTDQYLKEAGAPPGFHEFLQMGFAEMGNAGFGTVDNRVYSDCAAVLKIALASPFTAKAGDKILIPGYNAGSVPLDKMKIFLEKLRAEFGDTFIVAGELVINHDDAKKYHATGKVPPDVIEKYRAKAQAILDVFGAMQLRTTTEMYPAKGDYMTLHDTKMFREHIAPMIQELMRLPENKGRLIGASFNHGYINHLSGVNHGEFCTARLRDALDAAMLVNPDYYLLFEWDEVNENTCFQPTIYNSMALQRLIRAYARMLKGRPQEPNKWDDPSIPNLILSHRAVVRLGEPLQFEMLSIPDSEKAGTFEAVLTLRSVDGSEIMRFPAEKFQTNQMRAVTYTIPAEQLSGHIALVPELETVGAKGEKMKFDQFAHVAVNTTTCYNYKAVRQPLRDLARPVSARFSAAPDKSLLSSIAGVFSSDGEGPRAYRVEGEIDAGEPLASVEVVDSGSEVFAVDNNNEFDRSASEIFIGTMSSRVPGLKPFKLSIQNSTGWKFRPWEAPNISFGSWKRGADSVAGEAFLWAAFNRFILTVPKADVANAVLVMEVSDSGRMSFPLADLVSNGKMAKAFAGGRLDLEKFNKLPDVPVHIDNNKASFSTTLVSDFRFPVYEMRAVTKSGKIFRSKPVVPTLPKGENVAINVLSETKESVVSVSVPRSRVPDLKYVFDPACGDMIRDSYEPFYDGELGGGFIYDEAMHTLPLPSGKEHAPEWVRDGDAWALKFDGVSDYVNFTRETFPRGSFTLEFDIKPESDGKPMILFRHFGSILGSMSVFVKDGKLRAGFGDREVKTRRFFTDLELPSGKWSSVRITYDLKKMTFSVNGAEESFDYSGRALYFKPCIFGGNDKVEFGVEEKMGNFKGLMRKFSIRHFVEPKEI